MVRTRFRVGDGLRSGVEQDGGLARREIEILKQADAPLLFGKLLFVGDGRRERRELVG